MEFVLGAIVFMFGVIVGATIARVNKPNNDNIDYRPFDG